MSNITDKGTTLDFTVGQDNWGPSVNDDFHLFDAWARTDWAFDPINSSALGYHYFGGVVFTGGAYAEIAGGSIILADNSVNYVERTTAGVVSRNATGFTVGSIPMAKITTSGGIMTVVEDWRGADRSTGVAAGSYGDSSHVATFTVDATGRLTAAAAVALAGLASRATVTKTTGSLANNAVENGTVTLAKSSLLHSIQADRACRVVFYSTSAARTADASRALGTPASPGLGILAEFAFTAAGTTACGPLPLLANDDGPATTSVYYALTNLSGETHTVSLTLVHLKLEA